MNGLKEECVTELKKPMTPQQLALYYHNDLIENDKVYTEQFLNESGEEHSKFKVLLQNYYQARKKLLENRLLLQEKNELMDGQLKHVFVTGEESVNAVAFCQDRRKVTTTHVFETFSFDENQFKKLSLTLQELRHLTTDEILTNSFKTMMGRLNCEQYLCEARDRFIFHRKNLIQARGQSDLKHQLFKESQAEVKQACNSLFDFLRKFEKSFDREDVILLDVKRWLTVLIVTLLHSSTDVDTWAVGQNFQEELFVLNHILRCPPGFCNWAVGLTQISTPVSTYPNSKTAVDHFVYMLHIMLHPKQDLGAEMPQNGNTQSKDKTPKADWVLVNKESQAEITPCLFPLENDLVVLFEQFPFEEILIHVLNLEKYNGDSYEYPERRFSEDHIMSSLVICNSICEILADSLTIFAKPDYKQLVRMIAQVLRNIILLLSLHIKYHSLKSPDTYSFQRLKLEFDEFCKRCVTKMAAVNHLGVYQYLADIPFEVLSLQAVERICVLLFVPCQDNSNAQKLLGCDYSAAEWKAYMRDRNTIIMFQENLCKMPMNEIVYLLTALANLVQSRPGHEMHLIDVVTEFIYMISFVFDFSKEVCCKAGRELLSTISIRHPFVISTVIQYIRKNYEFAKHDPIYALGSLYFSQWIPSADDLKILQEWIVDYKSDSVQSVSAQLIIEGLNFGTGVDSDLTFLPIDVHSKLAMILVEADKNHNLQKMHESVVMKGFDHISKVAAVTARFTDPSEKFTKWCWKILLLLKLHPYQCTDRDREEGYGNQYFTDEMMSTYLASAVKDGSMIANYISIMIESFKNPVDYFRTHGVELLYNLAAQGHTRAVANCLFCVLPTLSQQDTTLLLNDRLRQSILLLLHSKDSNFLSEITQHLINQRNTEYQPVDLLISVVLSQLENAKVHEEASGIIICWLNIIFAVENWYLDTHLLVFIDFLYQQALLLGEACLHQVRSAFHFQFQKLLEGKSKLDVKTSQSFVSTFSSLMLGSNKNYMPTLVDNFSKNVYFAYAVLEAETRHEQETKLWPTFINLFAKTPGVDLETCLSNASKETNENFDRRITQLAICRWGELALSTKVDHPMMEAIWFQFFFLYIWLPFDGGNSQGCRLFSTNQLQPLYNKLKQRLQEIQNHYISSASNESGGIDVKLSNERIVHLYQCFKLWLEEPKLHEANLYFPSLPAQYNPELLASIRTRDFQFLTGYIKTPILIEEWKKSHQVLWLPLNRGCIHPQPNSNQSESLSDDDILLKMTHLLRQFTTPLPLPVDKAITSPVSLNNSIQLWDYNRLLNVTSEDIETISHFSQQFAKFHASLEHADKDYLKTLPNLYYMKESEICLTVKCKAGFAASYKCSGPAQVRLLYREKAVRKSVAQNIGKNRKLYSEAMDKLVSDKVCSKLCLSALHLEKVIDQMERNSKNMALSEAILNSSKWVGLQFFYLLANKYSHEIHVCHPARQILSYCVENLGQAFVFPSSDNARKILEKILAEPLLGALLSPFFNPGVKQSSDHSAYVQMYQNVVKAVTKPTDHDFDVVFVLLTKFDFNSWLNEASPKPDVRLELLQYIFVGLVSCCHETKQMVTSPARTALEGIYLSHLKAVLCYNFPEILEKAFEYLFEASRTGEMHLTVWNEILDISSIFKSSTDLNETSDAHCNALDWYTLLSVNNLVSNYFMECRTKSGGESDIYSQWLMYIVPISKLLTNLSENLLFHTKNKSVLNEYSVSDVMSMVFQLYGAWLDPIESESGEVSWPWVADHTKLAHIIAQSFTKILENVCAWEGTTSEVLHCIWEHCAKIFLTTKYDQHVHVYTTYQRIVWDLPWSSFRPDIYSMERIVQMCDNGNNASKDLLCRIVSLVSWADVLQKCDGTAESKNYNSEIVCRLLHALFTLGASEQRLVWIREVIKAFHTFPMDNITVDQVEFLSNIISDLYPWTSILLNKPVRSLAADSRTSVIRILKMLCQLPLVGEERSAELSGPQSACQPSQGSLKQLSYLRCVGRILQKASPEKIKHLPEVLVNLKLFVESVMEGVDALPSSESTPVDTSTLVHTVFNYLNIFPSQFQQPTLNALIDVISRPAICNDCIQQSIRDQMCQKCVYLRSRAMSSDVLLACLTTACNSSLPNSYSTQLAECSLENYITTLSVENTQAKSDDWYLSAWLIVKMQFKKSQQEEFQKECISQSSLLSLHVTTLNLEFLPYFYAHISEQAEIPGFGETTLLDLLAITHQLLEWLPQVSLLSSNEAKIILILDHFFFASSVLWDSQTAMTEGGKAEVAKRITQMLPILLQMSQDKVRSGGIWGSIGLSSQSPLSIEFRFLAKALATFINCWHKTEVEKSSFQQDWLDDLKTPQILRQATLAVCSKEICIYLCNKIPLSISDGRRILSTFVSLHYASFMFLFHLIKR